MRISILHKIVGLAVTAAVLPVLSVVVIGLDQRGIATDRINAAIDSILAEDLERTTRGIYDLCKTANDLTQQNMDHSLNVAGEEIVRRGGLALLERSVRWEVENQYTGLRKSIDLPAMGLGGAWLPRQREQSQWVPVVDDVHQLVGATCTIFQRMNDAGDMLRIATNVPRNDGSRAIGTYIPAVNPDGRENPVVDEVLAGHVFRGRAYVVNDWYLTTYRPLRDQNDDVIGMVYVGVRQESAESFRQSIRRTRVGRHGHLFALGASDAQKGHWLVTPDESVVPRSPLVEDHRADSEVIRAILDAATSHPPGELSVLAIDVDGQADAARVAVTHFPEWDWVVGAVAYEEDFRTARNSVHAAMSTLLTHTNLWGLGLLLSVSAIAVILALRMTRPIEQMSRAAEQLAEGRTLPTVDVRGRDEIARLSRSFNAMSQRIGHQRQQLESTNIALAEANATKDRFFSIIAHDLKNPFSVLISYSAALLESLDGLSQDRIRAGIETLRSNSERGFNLLLDLLEWSRSQSGALEIVVTPVELKTLVDDALDLVAERADRKGIEVSHDVATTIVAEADANMVGTILRNLVTNAVKFSERGDRIRVSARRVAHEIQVTVEDTGIGISEANQQKLFRLDAFYRQTGTDRESGTGLGLILCKEFVERLDGRIWVESSEGHGSRFSFTLPVVPAEPDSRKLS